MCKKAFALILAVIIMMTFMLPCVSAYEIKDSRLTWQGHTYRLFDEPMTWHEAKSYCESIGGYLATITSAEEQNAVTRLVRNGTKGTYWLGATDEATEGEWQWVTGEPWKFNFGGTFDAANGGEDYLQMYRTANDGNGDGLGKWNDSSFNNSFKGEEYFFNLQNAGFVCEFGEAQGMPGAKASMPIVYIIGRTGIYAADGRCISNFSTESIVGAVTNSLPELKNAILKGDWDGYCDSIYAQIEPVYAEYRLNSRGEVENGSGNAWHWSQDSVPDCQGNIFTYRFEYDARIDPYEIADDLYNYIETVKAKTGHSKVHLISRCLGCNIAASYLAKYGYGSVATNIFFASAAMGYDFVGQMFAGKYEFNDDAIYRYGEENAYVDGDAIVNELVNATLSVASKNGLLKIGTGVGEAVFNRLSEKIVPRLLLATYATCPGYWAMVNDENYEQAKQYVFGEEANTTYKELVAKIDNYHYNVQQKLPGILKTMESKGVKMNVLCKYGYQTPPFIAGANKIGDNRIEVVEQSFGATTTEMEKHFLPHEIAKAKREGRGKFISPDKQIDASTCLFPNSTWFVKNLEHNPFYDSFNVLMTEMCYSPDQMTVESDSAFPQYLHFNQGNHEISPLTEDNMNTVHYDNNIFAALIRFIKAVFNALKSLRQ